jgi:hypothetical protein
VQKSRLPAKQTTKHVPRHRLPVGAVNRKGFMKLIDKTTGRVRYVDAKKGLIRAPDGDPTTEIE